MAINEIQITGARVHNLKNISLAIPKNKLVVISGPSGSGKSSLAFDTLYVEGQRRYIESLSSYARQFLEQFQPPEVESISGLSPAIAINQGTSSRNPRSTVGTITEIYDYLRILYARIGKLYCPTSNIEIRKYSPTQVANEILNHELGAKIIIFAPLYSKLGENIPEKLHRAIAQGFTRARLNNEIISLEEVSTPKELSQIDIVIDRVILKADIKKRLVDSIELAMKFCDGNVLVDISGKNFLFSEKNVSPATFEVFPPLSPQLFSFNSPVGACHTCKGIGSSRLFSMEKMILDKSLSIADGAIRALSKRNSFFYKMVQTVAEIEGVDLATSYRHLPKSFIKILWHGTSKKYEFVFTSENSQFNFTKPFEGILSFLDRKYLDSATDKKRLELEAFMSIQTCPDCAGRKLNPIALSTRIGECNISELAEMTIADLYLFITTLKLDNHTSEIAKNLLKEIRNRLQFLLDVGLHYLTLSRNAASLAGGEAQRIRLATQIGSSLTGVLYILDEPSIGLHPRDTHRLINTLINLKNLGNTVIVVEHDLEVINSADYLIDFGPEAGSRGGEITAAGTLDEIRNATHFPHSKTAQLLANTLSIAVPATRNVSTNFLKIFGVNKNNLKNIDVEIPLNSFVCLTGVSGSGKSTLMHQVLVPAVRNSLSKKSSLEQSTNYRAISGIGQLKGIIELDQGPIGRTPNSNPATYTGIFDEIRKIFAMSNESKLRGYSAGRFSFNVKGGRCEECEGDGVKKIEMHFLPDVYIKCNECNGTRYNQETLSILYKGKNIHDVLHMTVAEAMDFFSNHPKIYKTLSTLNDVGLSYLQLGQPANTLSGGEAQRLKLSRELSRKTYGNTLYILDEPSTGLHIYDIKILLSALMNLVKNGNSVLVIEHNIEIIKTADYIIDLGPEGGAGGGELVAFGTPEQICQTAATQNSHTVKYLASALTR